MVNGTPHTVGSAAKVLGMRTATLEKRIRRGADLLKPVKRQVREGVVARYSPHEIGEGRPWRA